VCMQIKCHTLQNCANFLDGNIFDQDAVQRLKQGCAARVVCLQSADSQKIWLFWTFIQIGKQWLYMNYLRQKKHLPAPAITCWWVVWYFVNNQLPLGRLFSQSISGCFVPTAHPANMDGKMAGWSPCSEAKP